MKELLYLFWVNYRFSIFNKIPFSQAKLFLGNLEFWKIYLPY